MTQCASEREWPGEGIGWKAPESLETIRVETPRLVIRLYAVEDAAEVFESVDSCRAYLSEWMDWVAHYERVENATEYIVKNMIGVRKLAETREIGVGIYDRETGKHVGGIGFHGLKLETAAAEFGYWIRKDLAGHGYASEASQAWLSFMLRPQAEGGMGMARVRAYCSGDNPASRRVLEKLGLPLEVVQRQDYFVKGFGLTSRIGFGVMHDEWDFTQQRALSTTPASRV
ncbi:MAG: RimJ/RimL family protein N-acetyltransferase [Phycisphaerales bacterium]|jgi:RimJ/RimL family protein N-acetyltransferase